MKSLQSLISKRYKGCYESKKIATHHVAIVAIGLSGERCLLVLSISKQREVAVKEFGRTMAELFSTVRFNQFSTRNGFSGEVRGKNCLKSEWSGCCRQLRLHLRPKHEYIYASYL